MIVGASIGRLVGELLSTAIQAAGGTAEDVAQVDPGMYALIGAAGILGGVTRMTISLTVIVVEVTRDTDLLLPIMFTILAAKLVGDRFTKSLYEIHIELSGVKLLETDNLPMELHLVPVRETMSRKVMCLREIESADNINKILSTCSHNGFPVVDDRGGTHADRFFLGTISRIKLEAALQKLRTGNPQQDRTSRATIRRSSDDAEKLSKALTSVGGSVKSLGGKMQSAISKPICDDGTAALRQAAREGQLAGRSPLRAAGRSSLQGIVRRPRSGSAAAAVTQSAGNLLSDEWAQDDRGLMRPHLAIAPQSKRTTAAGRPLAPARAKVPQAPVKRPKRISADGYEEGALYKAERELFLRVDLRPYVDRSPFVVHELQPLYRVCRLFHSMGLRSLSVVDSRYSVVGMVTRIDIINMRARTAVASKGVEGPQPGMKSTVAERRMHEARHQVDRLIRTGGGNTSSAKTSTNGSPTSASGHVRKRRHSEPDMHHAGHALGNHEHHMQSFLNGLCMPGAEDEAALGVLAPGVCEEINLMNRASNSGPRRKWSLGRRSKDSEVSSSWQAMSLEA